MGGIEKWNNAYPFYMNQDFGNVRLNANSAKVTCNPYYQKWTIFRRMVNDYNAFVSIDGEEVAPADSAAPTGGGEENGVLDERNLAYEESLAAKEEKKKAWLLKNVSRHHIEIIDYFNEKFPNSVAGEDITEFQIGSFVTVSYPENQSGVRKPPAKLLTHRKGPFLVLSHEGPAY